MTNVFSFCYCIYCVFQGGFVLPGVCLSVCLLAFTRLLLIESSWEFYQRCVCGQERTDWILKSASGYRSRNLSTDSSA